MPKQSRTIKLPRLVTGLAAFDQFIETWAQAIEGLYNITYGPQFEVVDSPTGKTVALKRPARICAQITDTNGDGSYAWSEVYGTASGGWSALTGGRSGTLTSDQCWEFNKLAGVQKDTVVELELNAETNEWRFPAPSGGMVKAKNGGSSVGPGATGSGNLKADGSGDAITFTNPYPVSSVPANAFMWLDSDNGGYEAVSWEC